jgi:SAM-dependent methyltransferase
MIKSEIKKSPDVQDLYTRRAQQYVSFVSSFRHQPGIEALLDHYGLLRDGLSVLDAGCGTGMATFALLDAVKRRGLSVRRIDAFDLTPAMLDRFESELARRRETRIAVCRADVLALDSLPSSWTGYELIVSVSMLEYVPRERLTDALRALRARLAPGGRLLAVITRKNPLTRWLIEAWWHARRYSSPELTASLRAAGFGEIHYYPYPFRFFWLNFSNHVVVAKG